MKNKSILSLLSILAIAVTVSLTACKKLNDSTSIGAGLIPPVDNINTFDTILSVETYNDVFGSTDSITSYGDMTQVLGLIQNDPLFGKTDARMFFQLSPTVFETYPFIQHEMDSVFLDSVVLVLDVEGVYGDTAINQTVKVFEIDPLDVRNFKADSGYLVRQEHFLYGPELGQKTFKPENLKDTVNAYKDSARTHQLRIPLSTAFGERLIHATMVDGPYASDSAFKTFFKGFALKSEAGNALMAFDLTGDNTKLAIYYKYLPTGQSTKDTSVTYFKFTTTCGAAQYVSRDHSFAEIFPYLGAGVNSDKVYIQSAPGTYAKVKIPGLSGLSNNVIHSAELIMEQIKDVSDTIFTVPSALFVDAYDPTITNHNKYRTLPFSFLIDNSGYPNYPNFGCYPVLGKNPAGEQIYTWRFNLTRYVQNIVNSAVPYYELRLSAPVTFKDFYKPYPTFTDLSYVFEQLNGTYGPGRVRLGGGSHATQPMHMRIVYSKQ